MRKLNVIARGVALAITGTLMTSAIAAPPAANPQKPNIVFILMDNLGYGELGVYGGGIVRGAPTPNTDRLASQGMMLTNFNVEAQSTPSRSAFMTGRFPIRSGTYSIPIGQGFDGLTQWEETIAEVLSKDGYATAAYGKWHLGSSQGRLPNDQGFDEWYGIPRTTDEAFWTTEPEVKANGIHLTHIMEGKKGEKSVEKEVYGLNQRRQIDEDLTQRAKSFIQKNAQAGKPFYLYLPYTQVHFPTLPNKKYAGKTGNGDFADAIVEMDDHVGEIMKELDDLHISENTILVFTSDNGPEATWPWQGSSGPWRGYYFTHMEGSLRVPFIIRWPGHIPAGRKSNEIVHAVDTYTTLAKLTGAQIPQDRVIDGVDQSDFLLGKTDKSARDGFPVYVADRLEAIKWHDWKVVFYEDEKDWWSAPVKLGVPKVFNLISDPKEEYAQLSAQNSWVSIPTMKLLQKHEQSLINYPPIKPGTPDPYTPPVSANK